MSVTSLNIADRVLLLAVIEEISAGIHHFQNGSTMSALSPEVHSLLLPIFEALQKGTLEAADYLGKINQSAAGAAADAMVLDLDELLEEIFPEKEVPRKLDRSFISPAPNGCH